MAAERRLLTRVVLKNYKSFAACDVSPAQLCFLVGRNGSGKSNFLDALRFIADSLRQSLDHALRDRGGIHEVRRRSGGLGRPAGFGMRIEFNLPNGARGRFAFSMKSKKEGAYEINREDCIVVAPENRGTYFYSVKSGKVILSNFQSPPAAAADQMYLVRASGAREFRAAYAALSNMGFYNLNLQALRDPQPSDPGDLLQRDGRNAASVLDNLKRYAPEAKEHLEKVVPGLVSVERRPFGGRETLEFSQENPASAKPWRFSAGQMSDGTLRGLGVLLALFQGGGNGRARPGLIGIEEPEVALHPGAAGVLIDSLRDAAARTQVLVTSHSPDLLDDKDISADSILAVEAEHGGSRVGSLDEVNRSVLKDRLYTVGELLKMGQIEPDPVACTPRSKQVDLFGL